MLFSLLILLVIFPYCSPSKEKPLIRYLVDITDPSSHNFNVAIHFHAQKGKVHLQMPASTPGALIQNNAKYVKKFRALNENQQVMESFRFDKDTWLVTVPKSQNVSVYYKVQRNEDDELRLTTNWLEEKGGYFFGTTILMYSREWLDVPVLLDLKLPKNWQIVTSLPKAKEIISFAPKNYRELVNYPIQFGFFQEKTVLCDELTFRLIFDTQLPTYDEELFVKRIIQIARFHKNLFRSAPFKEYIVLFHYRPDLDYGGGVSRNNMMIMNLGKEWMDNLPGNISGTFAHELFHAWNFATFYPKELGQYDFARENYSGLTWFIEGVTNYYVYLCFVRTGLITPELLFNILSNDINSYEASPGRGWIGLKEADIVNWIGGAESLNISSGGAVFGFLLDLEIRLATFNGHSLDDVMRALFAQSQKPGYQGYSEDDLINTIGEITSHDFKTFFDLYVNNKNSIDYHNILNRAGLSLEEKVENGFTKYTIIPNSSLTEAQIMLLDSLTGQISAH